LAGVGLVVMIGATIIHTFNYKRDYYIPAADVTRTEDARTLLLDSHA
jgi:cytochrome o ubiquinol oxidase subunit 1